jgi:hypothetical protein
MSDTPLSRPALGSDLRFLALTIAVPLLLVVMFSLAFWVLGTILLPAPSPGGEPLADYGVRAHWNVSYAIIVTFFVGLPLFIVAVLRHFGDQ